MDCFDLVRSWLVKPAYLYNCSERRRKILPILLTKLIFYIPIKSQPVTSLIFFFLQLSYLAPRDFNFLLDFLAEVCDF